MYGKANPAITLTVPPLDQVNLTGKTVTVVGGTNGIGRALALAAAACGASVTIVGRTDRDQGRVKGISFVQCDLTSMKSAQELGRTLEPADLVAFTTGTGPAKKRQDNGEGIEKDMAVSCLSRLVILRELLPRMAAGSRVAIWGMPGNGAKTRLADLNAEGQGYEGNFGWVHMNTVAGNEAMVLHLASQPQWKDKVTFVGMNPGLIKTTIRDFMHGGKCIGSMGEGILGLFTPSAKTYAARMLPLLFAPSLQAHSGALFGQKGRAILPSKQFQELGHAYKWYAAMEELLKAKTGI